MSDVAGQASAGPHADKAEHVARIGAKRTPYMVTERDYLAFRSHREQTLDEVIAEAVRNFDMERDTDQAVWHGASLVGFLRKTRSGKGQVAWFDGDKLVRKTILD
jgi:hypothetical protein